MTDRAEQERAAALEMADEIAGFIETGEPPLGDFTKEEFGILEIALRALAARHAVPADLREVVKNAPVCVRDQLSDRQADAVLSAIQSAGYDGVKAGGLDMRSRLLSAANEIDRDVSCFYMTCLCGYIEPNQFAAELCDRLGLAATKEG